jgi:Prophage minor tail protein Z (GPZ)
MASSLTIEFDADKALEVLQRYPRRTTKATMRALNRALTSGNAELARLIAKDMGLKVSEVKAALKSTPATETRLEVKLSASAKRIPLAKFAARQTRKGVSYNLGAGGGGRKVLAHSFIATVGSGHTGVFTRKTAKRLPIDQKFGPSIGGVLARYRRQGIAKMRETFDARLAHELRFAATE